ncbi:unnamed protein product [Sphacelaria rigidula]
MTGVRVVLHCLLSTGLTANFQKLQWCTATRLRGMTVDASGIRSSQSEIEAITRLMEPRNVEGLRSFLGMTRHLRRYIKGYIALAAPLTNLLRGERFATKGARTMITPWRTQQRQAFLDLKKAMMSYPILAYPE